MKPEVRLTSFLALVLFGVLLPMVGNAQRSDESTRVKVNKPQEHATMQMEEGMPAGDGQNAQELAEKHANNQQQADIKAAGSNAAVVAEKAPTKDSAAVATKVTRPVVTTPPPVEKKPAFLGVHYEMEYGPSSGSHITKVEPGTPAFKAGLKTGDIITQADGITLYQLEDLADIISKKKAGDKVRITYLREGKSLSTWVILAERNEEFFKNNQGPTYRIERIYEDKPGS